MLLFFLQYKDINTRLKSLQEDYKTQQNTHCEELEVKAKQLATAKNSIVQLEDEIAQLQVQLICTKREMNTVKEQLDKATTVSCVLASQLLSVFFFKEFPAYFVMS